MAILFALSSALAYGVADFLAGVVSRSWDSRLVTLVAQLCGVLTAVVAVVVDPGSGPGAGALVWGGLSGLGSALGILSLYRGFAHGSISVVAPVCGVLTAVLPALVGILLLGNRVSAPELVGIVLTVPAVGLVSRETVRGDSASGGFLDGALAGIGFGFLFVALDRAGSRHGAWPLLAGQVVSVLAVGPVAWGARRTADRPGRRAVLVTVFTGILSGGANLLYIFATHHGQLAIVGVLSSLYPASTVLMARVWLGERWNRLQVSGLLAAVVSVALVALG